MPLFNHPYTLLLIFSAVLSAILTITALKYRPTLGTHSFAALTSCVGLWAFVALFEVASRDPMTKTFSYSLKFLFVVLVPLAWFTFCLYYSNRLRQLRWKQLALLMAMPTVTLLLIATNAYHHLMFTSLEWHRSANTLLVHRSFGLWFWVHTTYSYSLLLLGFIYLTKALIDSPAPYRGQVILLLIGGLTPWTCNILFIFNVNPFPYLDLTPFAFTVSGTAFMWGIVRYRLLDIVPIAREVVIQSMADAILVIDNDNRILDFNPAAANLVDMEAGDLIGANAELIIPWWSQMPAIEHEGRHSNRSDIRIDHGAKEHLFRVTLSPVFCKEKRMGHLILLQDITASKTAEDALRNSEARFRSLTENAPVIIFALNNDGIITYVNPACMKILGYERREIIGYPFYEFVVENHTKPHAETFKKLIEGREAIADLSIYFLHKDGSKRLFNASAAVNTDPEGRVTGIIGMAKDITEERRLQHQLFQSQKMEAIGTLAGGIAHDFNNLLMGMQANISLMRLEFDTTAALQEKLNRMESQIQSGASLTRQLLGYARKGKYVVTTINFSRLIEETLNVVQRTNKNIITRCELTTEPSCVEADRGQMELVLLNLFVNAIDAMPNGGELSVSTRLCDHQELIRIWPECTTGRYIETKIIDTGVGIDPSTMDRIFEPFFTTKEMGQGTGLGLASVYGVVKNHGGHIRVDSQLGQGSTFTLLLPASEKIAEVVYKDEQMISLPPRSGSILLVDDEPLVLEYCGEMIESLGYSVILAENGDKALEVYKDRYHKIDLVILDMVMPDMDGSQVYEALKAINPKLRVILSSGYAVDERSERILADGPNSCLKKPYTRDQLARTVNAVLGCRSPADNNIGLSPNLSQR